MVSEHSERYYRHQQPPVRQLPPGWVHQPQYHDFEDMGPPDNAAELDPNAFDPPEYVYSGWSQSAAQHAESRPAYPQDATNYDSPQTQATSFPLAFTATVAHRPHPERVPAFSTSRSAPATAVPRVQHGAYSPSSSEISPTSLTPPLTTLSSGADLFAVGAWDNGAAVDYADPPKETRGREESKKLKLTNLPGKSKRSESTEVHRSSSPKNEKEKKRRGNKNSKSAKSGHREDRSRSYK